MLYFFGNPFLVHAYHPPKEIITFTSKPIKTLAQMSYAPYENECPWNPHVCKLSPGPKLRARGMASVMALHGVEMSAYLYTV